MMFRHALLLALIFSLIFHLILLLPIFERILEVPFVSQEKGKMVIDMGSLNRVSTYKAPDNFKNTEVNPHLEVEKRGEKIKILKQEASVGSVVEDKNLRYKYFSEVRAKIERVKKYPFSARERGFEGISEVSFDIFLNGEVKNISLEKSSGYEELDREALSTIKRAAPFEKIPFELNLAEVKLKVPIAFVLK